MVYVDFQGRQIRLPEERIGHILRRHQNITGMEWAIEETLAAPDEVRKSLSDPQVNLYYRWYTGTSQSDKYMCVVVKIEPADAFVLTAYLTNRVRGAP